MNAHEYDGKYNVTDDGNCLEPIGNGDLFNKGTCYGSLVCNTGEFHGSCSLHFYVRDRYHNPWDYFSLLEKIGTSYETGTPYRIHADWFKTKYWQVK